MTILELDNVTVTYEGSDRPALANVSLRIEEGEWLLVSAPTGAGKSTLLGLCNGLVPHFTGGNMSGTVTVAGRSTEQCPPRNLADVVGWVGQDPASGFVTDAVEDELAFVMEELATPPATMRRRIEETLDLMGIAELRNRPLSTLSGGEAQRVAIASVLCASPKVLLLDEPTSALDPAGADDVLAALGRLVHDVGLTVIMSEHRLERVIHLVDRIALIDRGQVTASMPDEALAIAPHVPPVIELGRLAGWSPLPRSVRDARRVAAPLISRLADAATPPAGPPPHTNDSPRYPVRASRSPAASGHIAVTGISLAHGRRTVVERVSFEVGGGGGGEVLALMGRNGAGKTTILRAVAGLTTPSAGRLRIGNLDPAAIDGPTRIRSIGFVPQDPTLLLYSSTVAEECRAADRDGGLDAGTTASVLEELAADGTIDANRHPRDLSAGQQLQVALAVVLAPAPTALLLDEPTRGLDHGVKDRLASLLRHRATNHGVAILLATHDVEFAATVADRVVLLGHREVTAAGPAAEVLSQSTVFAPQVARILSPLPVLTVAAIRRTLGRIETNRS